MITAESYFELLDAVHILQSEQIELNAFRGAFVYRVIWLF